MDWENIKGFLGGMLVRWVLKVGAGVIGTLGVSQGSATEVVSAVVMFAVGALISLIQHKKAIDTPAPK
jgi:hypothetical protein